MRVMTRALLCRYLIQGERSTVQLLSQFSKVGPPSRC